MGSLKVPNSLEFEVLDPEVQGLIGIMSEPCPGVLKLGKLKTSVTSIVPFYSVCVPLVPMSSLSLRPACVFHGCLGAEVDVIHSNAHAEATLTNHETWL